jgi:hypothetical protein
MRARESFWLAHKEKLLFAAAAAVLAGAAAVRAPGLPDFARSGPRVSPKATGAQELATAVFVDADREYFDERKRWIFVEEAVVERKPPVQLPLPRPAVPAPPWPMPRPGPLLEHSKSQPRLGQPLDKFELPEDAQKTGATGGGAVAPAPGGAPTPGTGKAPAQAGGGN